MAQYIVTEYQMVLTAILDVTVGMLSENEYSEKAKAETLEKLGGDPSVVVIGKNKKIAIDDGIHSVSKNSKWNMRFSELAKLTGFEFVQDQEKKADPYVTLRVDWFDIRLPTRDEVVELAWGAVMDKLNSGSCGWAEVETDPTGTITVRSRCEMNEYGSYPLWVVTFFFPGHSPASISYKLDPAVRRR